MSKTKKEKKEMKEQDVLHAAMTQAENKKNRKLPYDPPVFKVMGIKTEGSFCTSTSPDVQNSSSDNWENDTNHEGGVIYLGSGTIDSF